jgi:hypothetical protein
VSQSGAPLPDPWEDHPMNTIPDTEYPVVVRTDFTAQAAWDKIRAAIRTQLDGAEVYVEFVDDPGYAGATKEQLLALLPADYAHPILFVVDGTTISGADHPILVVDLVDSPGREFRTIPVHVHSIEANLSIANMDYDEFAEAVDAGGVFRGFPAV